MRTADRVKKLDAEYRARAAKVPKGDGDGFSKPSCRGKPCEWREPELPTFEVPPPRPLEELDDVEIDFLNDRIEFLIGSIALERALDEEHRADFLRSGEGRRALGIVREGVADEVTRKRVEVSILDFKARCEAEERSRARLAEKKKRGHAAA